MTNVLVDNHHCSLLRSLFMLFEGRLGYETFRPVGMSWWENGFWAINDLKDTATQYLDPASQAVADGTPPLNVPAGAPEDGVYTIYDPGGQTTHKAITFDAFRDKKFDFVVASITEHIPLFKELIRRYQPEAKLIIQVGNNWPEYLLRGHNVMASITEGSYPLSNAIYYHQEFSTDLFCPPDRLPAVQRVSSYVNVLGEQLQGFADFSFLEPKLREHGIPLSSYGGQCRDGNFAGANALAESMKQDTMILHVKDYGDGFGHIIHNAFATGVPLIVRDKFIKGTLASVIINENNSIDLDAYTEREAVDRIVSVMSDPVALQSMREETVKAFVRNVDFEADAKRVETWLQTLI